MRKSGFREGYHPTPTQLQSLRIHNKKKRNYIDDSGNVFSSRAVQEAKYGYISLEQAKQLRKQGWGEILNYKKRGELPISLDVLARQWELKHKRVEGTAFKNRRFRRDMEELIKKARQLEELDEYEYDEFSEFLDDTFDLTFEELTYYHAGK